MSLPLPAHVPEYLLERLATVSTATACWRLLELGLRNTYVKGLYPLMPLGTGNLVVGRAVTVRYLPFREDVDAAIKPEERLNQPYRRAIESLESADIPVIDATGNLEAGAIGDVLAARIKYRGASAALVDGAVRDGPHIRQVGLPTFMRGAHPSAGPRAIMSMDVNLRIQCGGVPLMPGDMILADDEAAAVAPPGYAEAVATQGLEQEAMELFIRAMIEQGVSIQQTYPPDESVRAEYEAYRLSRSATGSL